MSDDHDLADLLAGCEQQVLHRTASIQSFGLLLRCDNEGRISHASDNCEEHIGIPANRLLGTPINQLIDDISLQEVQDPQTRFTEARLEGKRYDLVNVTADDDLGGLTLEINPSLLIEDTPPPGAEFALFQEINDDFDLQEALEQLAREVRKISKFDRVVIYRFAEDWSGEVVAEASNDTLPRYLGLRFPASDIPEPARNLYLKQPWRLIADVGAEPVPLLAEDGAATLDMTHCDLRQVAPVHLEYLRNMGVKASFSVSLLVQGKLWGLIACHHSRPRYIGYPLRRLCHYITRGYAIRLLAIQARNRMHLVDSIEHDIEILTRSLIAADTNDHLTDDIQQRLLKMVEADGAMLVSEQGVRPILPDPSTTIPESELLYLDRWFMGLESELLAENGIQEQCPWMGISAKEICGLLAIRTPLRNPNGTIDWLRFYWWRKELPQHVRWAGAPEKAVDRDERGVPYLSPRRSFEEWLELKRGESKPWSSGDLLTAKKFRGSVLRWLIHH